MEIRALTVDSHGTRDIDDAIWVEHTAGGWAVHVTIADVSREVEKGELVDLEARQRGATKYFATGNSPMLPHFLSEERCSLWPKKKRHGVVVEMTLSEDFTLTASRIFRAEVSSEAKLAYEDVPRILENAAHPLHTVITHAARLAVGLMERRRKEGAFVLYDINNGWISTEEGYLRQLKNIEETIGHVVIQELMVLANRAVAGFAVEHDVPILFRNHQARSAAPDRAVLMQQVQDAVTQPLANIDVVRERVHVLLGRAEYGSHVHGHYGLNVPFYTHFTSPIRRYPDLVNHRQILAQVEGAAASYTREDLALLAAEINATINNEREETAAYLKAKAERKAERAISARRLDGLGPKEFERVTKVEARSGRPPSQAFIEGFLSRLKENRVPLVCATTLFTETTDETWEPLKVATVEHLARFPADAQSLVTQATSIAGWPTPSVILTEEGPPHARRFAAKAVLQLSDRTIESDPFVASTSKDAKQRAMVGLLAKMCNAPTPTFTAVPAAAASTKRPVSLATGKDPVSALQEYAQALGTTAPEYTYPDPTGPKHALTFTCNVNFQGAAVSGSGPSKVAAKKAAAARLVDVLSRPQAQSYPQP